MRPVVGVLDTSADLNLIQADVLDPTWPDSIRLRDNPDIRSAYNTTLKVSWTIILHLRMSE